MQLIICILRTYIIKYTIKSWETNLTRKNCTYVLNTFYNFIMINTKFKFNTTNKIYIE